MKLRAAVSAAAIFLSLFAIHTPSAQASERLKPGAIIYGVVPPLFGHSPFRDVTRKLDYLQKAGVDYIWLSPINDTDDESAISYAVTDHYNLRRDFGTEEDLQRLVKEAHRRGMRVLMDFIPNHTSTGSGLFIDAQKGGPGSEYWDFYQRDRMGNPVFYFDWENLPNLNFSNRKVVDMIAGAFKHWVKDFGIDGYRVDVAWGVRERRPSFWSPMNRELRRMNPNNIMIAEASARDPYYAKNGFDLAYDWTEKLGVWAWKLAFDDPKNFARHLHNALHANPNPTHVARYLNNNDTGQRFITRFGPRVTKVAAVLQHTVPGIPVLYTGDEMGLEYEPYDDIDPLVWRDRHGLAPLYRKLAELREQLPALHSGDFTAMPANTQIAYGYMWTAPSNEWAVTLLNFGKAAELRFQLPKDIKAKNEPVQFHDAITGRVISGEILDGELIIKMNELEALILVP